MYQSICMLLILFLTSSCTGVPENIKVIQSMDASQYLGTWYEIARLDNRFERGLDNVTATYQMRDDGGIKVINKGYSAEAKAWKEAIGKAYFIDKPNIDGTRTGKLKVSFFGPFYGGYNIITLDKPYYNYVMLCGPNKDYFWILSRTPQLAYPIKQHLIAQAKELGFATDQLIYVNQTPETINYDAGGHIVK